MNRWFARLSVTFLILAGLLLYQAYREATQLSHPSYARIALYCVAAGICLGLSAKGTRERHKPPED